MSGTGAMTVNFVVLPVQPQPPPVWPVIVAALIALAASAGVAWRRARAGSRRPRRRGRIMAAALAGGGTATAMIFVSSSTAGESLGWDGPPSDLLLAAHLLFCVLLAGMFVGTGDLLFDALRPSRSRSWLAAGVPFFATFIVATFYATGSVGELTLPPSVRQAALVVAALAAGMTWWAWLPAPHEEVAGIFE